MSATTIDPYASSTAPAGRFLYRLNPLAKLGAPLPVMILLAFTRDPVTPALFIALAVVVILVGARLTRTVALLLFVALPLLVSIMSFSFGLWTDPSRVDQSVLLFQVGDYRFFLGALLVGLATALRLAALLLLACIGGLTSTGPEFVRAMIQQLHVPYRIGYTALAAYRFVPRFGHELEVIRSAHRVRGMAEGRGPIAAVRRAAGTVVPLLAGAIRHAERVALAMDSRAFGAHPQRTERTRIPFRTRDWCFMVAFWLVSAALLWWSLTAGPGPVIRN
ncbi:energy-coupling factor transporter transmembrane protein EcfT [Plantibacter sp. T3]|uniref:energy-coupling factor transporter transmembrane component T family protein n=1 Tax=Plantibacter sp. T3 TaxID=2653161 RepID=UPI0012F3EEED|nr:energy-coupling factor transporter transmembrane component T [Plantibacter sp. T3]VXB72828.1 Transmembrane component YkoC of energizing module of thiamin-regulated ECF transporter for HydroxyMethylPyrimidine [Plantibacter sp. T3]